MDPNLTSILSTFDPRLAVLLGWVTLVTMVFVDWVRTVVVLPKWATPAIALAIALVLLLVLSVAVGIDMTIQIAAQTAIIAVIATVIAMGASTLKGNAVPTLPTVPVIITEPAEEIANRIVSKLEAKALLTNEQQTVSK